MTTEMIGNWIALGSVVIGLGTYICTQWANRRFEIFKERLKRRMQLFEIIFPTIIKFIAICHDQNPSSNEVNQVSKQLSDLHLSVQLYGTGEESKIYKKLVDAINTENVTAVNKYLPEFSNTALSNLREELGFKTKYARRLLK